MKHVWKITVGAFALSVAMLGVTATAPAHAKEKSGDTANSPATPKKATSARAIIKNKPGECLSYTIDRSNKRVCSKTKIDSPK